MTPAVKREAVAHLRARFGLSERRAPDTDLRGRLRELANERRRFGYRRLFVLLRREGEPSGINRIYRLYREEGLTVRKRRARRKAVGTCACRDRGLGGQLQHGTPAFGLGLPDPGCLCADPDHRNRPPRCAR